MIAGLVSPEKKPSIQEAKVGPTMRTRLLPVLATLPVEPLGKFVSRGRPLLGICVGMQALFEVGLEMGWHPGLALLPGQVIHFPPMPDVKIPHTGWNQLWPEHQSSLMQGIEPGAYAYFNHSYYCDARPEDVLTRTDYGLRFASAVQHEALFAVQFHPEKSQQVGLKILENFMKI